MARDGRLNGSLRKLAFFVQKQGLGARVASAPEAFWSPGGARPRHRKRQTFEMTRQIGAAGGNRTRDIQLGKLTFYL